MKPGIEKHERADHTLYIDRRGKHPIASKVPKGEPPNFKQRAKNFTTSLIEHIKAGRPVASQELINERFAICSKCDFLNPELMQCNKCGCPIKINVGPFSKLSWADAKCPEKFW